MIARRVRELFIYCEIHPYNNPPKDVTPFKAVTLCLPHSVRAEDAPHPALDQIRQKSSLAVCYGAQYLAHFSGGKVSPSAQGNMGEQIFLLKKPMVCLRDRCWESSMDEP